MPLQELQWTNIFLIDFDKFPNPISYLSEKGYIYKRKNPIIFGSIAVNTKTEDELVLFLMLNKRLTKTGQKQRF